ncbi:NAD(P)-dependent oxidoreductase [Amycolatopsis lurida]
MRVGVVGAGRMGRPMVARLVDAGHAVRALGRSVEARAALVDIGATAVGEATEVTEGADVVLVCVHDDEQVRAVCLHGGLIERMPAGAVLVVHTTGSPRVVEDIAARGVTVVDAPVSGSPQDIAAGRVTLFAGGSSDAVEHARPALVSYSDPVLHVGDLGAGQHVKLLNNSLFAAHIGLLGEAVRCGRKWGVREEVLLDALAHGSAASYALTRVAPRGSVVAFTVAVAEFLGKDMAVARKVAAELGAELGAIDAAVTALPREFVHDTSTITAPP